MIVTDAELVRYVADYIGSHGYSPSVRDLCEAVGMASPGAMGARIKSLKSKGLITYVDKVPRTIRLTEKGKLECL